MIKINTNWELSIDRSLSNIISFLKLNIIEPSDLSLDHPSNHHQVNKTFLTLASLMQQGRWNKDSIYDVQQSLDHHFNCYPSPPLLSTKVWRGWMLDALLKKWRIGLKNMTVIEQIFLSNFRNQASSVCRVIFTSWNQ